MNAEEVITQLTDEEKAALVAGTRFMFTTPVPRLGIPSVETSDGPHGLRKQIETKSGLNACEKATAFPCAAALASSWNEGNARLMGEALAAECRHFGVGALLAPGVNIKRNPRAGRNFEYYSEDPLLAGRMAAGFVKGVQSGGVGVALKHFALNNAENFRFTGGSIADERAVREIYLKAFEYVVKNADPSAVMCAYNQINGVFASENEWLLTNVLRKEWGYQGLVMTDWGATHDRLLSLKAGCDLEMPGDTPYCRNLILKALKSGALEKSTLDSAVLRVLRFAEKYAEPQHIEADFEAHDALAAFIAADSAVLLKNDGVLPLSGKEKLLVAGGFFEQPRCQGAGSSLVNPTRVTSPKDAFDRENVKYAYERGYFENGEIPDEALISSAVEAAKNADCVLVFAGLSEFAECEGFDRDSLALPAGQLKLISELLKTGKKIVVVLYSGSVVDLPFADEVSAILYMSLPGQNGGTAACELLYGETCPSGRLAQSWVFKQSDVPFDNEFSTSPNEVYKESVFVGYRYFVTAKKAVRYPFGYGLSYTSFAYSQMEVSQNEDTVSVSCTVQNTGDRAGAEVVQLYVGAPRSDVFKPARELRSFEKVCLNAGETRRVTFTVNKSELCYFHPAEKRFVPESGEYAFEICRNAEEVELSHKIFMEGEEVIAPYSEAVQSAYRLPDPEKITDEVFEEMSGCKIPPLPAKKPLTTESRFTDFKGTFMGRILFRAVLGMAKRKRKRALRIKDAALRLNALKEALFLEKTLESGCPRSMSMSAGGRMPFSYAEGITHLANGHILRGLLCFMKKN